MARTSITGYKRQYGSDDKRATPAVFLVMIQFTIDISQASTTGTGKILPKGAIPLFVQNITGGGSGSSTVDIGFNGTAAAFANEILGENAASLTGAGEGTAGTSLGTQLTVNTEITAGAGSVAGTGNVTFGVYYVMSDDGSA